MPIRALASLVLAGAIVAGGQLQAAAPTAPAGAAGVQSAAPNAVESLDHTVSPAGHILIRLTFRDELAQPPAVLTTFHPSTSVSFDFAPMSSAIGRKSYEINHRGLRGLRLIPARDRTRLVVSLDHPHLYETELKGKELLIILRSAPSLGARDAAGEPRHSVRDVSFEPVAGGGGRIVVELSDPAVPVEVRQQGKALIVDFRRTSLPAHLARRLDVTDFGTSIRAIETHRLGNAVRIIVETAGTAEYSAHQLTRHLIVEPRGGAR